MKPEEAKDSLTRGEIIGYLSQNPGSYFNEMRQHLGYGNNQLTYHLKVLEQGNQIKSKKDGRLNRFYLKKFRVPDVQGVHRQITEVLNIVPELTRIQVAKLIHVTPKTATKLLSELLVMGKIRFEMKGNEKCYFVEDAEIEGGVKSALQNLRTPLSTEK